MVLAVSSDGRRGKGASGVSILRALISFMRTPLSCPNHLQEDPPTITLGIRISTHKFEGSTFSPLHTQKQRVTRPKRKKKLKNLSREKARERIKAELSVKL